MASPEAITAPPITHDEEDTLEVPRGPVAFRTAQGSVYSYDNEGKTSRFKSATGEQHERQDVTVFSPLSPEDEQDYLLAIHTRGHDGNTKAYVVERQPDNSGKVILDVAQVSNPDSLYLAILNNGKIVKTNKASLEPTVGTSVYDSRHYQQDGVTMSERHLGNKVTELIY